MNEKRLSELKHLHDQLLRLKRAAVAYEKKHAGRLETIHPQYEKSARNLLHYLALRRWEMRSMQFQLARSGLSSLGRCESYVMENLNEILARIADTLRAHGQPLRSAKVVSSEAVTWAEAESILHRHSRDIFGPRPDHRHEYIMVTAPELTKGEAEWSKRMLLAGTNLFRINCAHGEAKGWKRLIQAIRLSSRQLKVPCRILMDLSGPKMRVASPEKTKVKVGDKITLGGKKRASTKHLECATPEVVRYVKVGHRVLFDDGHFEGIITSCKKDHCEIEVTRTPPEKAKIKAEKGINFPDSLIRVAEITAEDQKNLQFVAEHADLIGLSFIQSPQALRTVTSLLRRFNRSDMGIVLKIETRAGFNALPRLMLEAMKHYPAAVMVARGDLAVEVGFDRLVEVQEEILWLCEAAHLPCIWATQVLESLAKTGVPSRAEVTDAAHSVRAECVMLNKGPYIDKSVELLSKILVRMEGHRYKKRDLYRPLRVARL